MGRAGGVIRFLAGALLATGCGSGSEPSPAPPPCDSTVAVRPAARRSIRSLAGLPGLVSVARSVGSPEAVRLAARAPGRAQTRGAGSAPAGPPASLTKVAGDSGIGVVGQAGPMLGVLVADQAGTPVPGVVVSWTVAAGGVTLGSDSTATDSTGVATVTLLLGSVPETDTIVAAVSGIPPVSFTVASYPAAQLVHSEPIPENYGIHDTFVRDGIAFVFAWNSGVLIYDVGKGVMGGTPAGPVQIGHLATQGGEAHNGWWFWNPVTSERRYLFVGQEGPGVVGAQSSGDIHVLDVSDLTQPSEVASFHLDGAGTHNFWMDEAAEVLYAAYYNAGVIALDVSGTLRGQLEAQCRVLASVKPGGNNNTYVWGVQLYNGSLYASDMVSGFWQLGAPGLGVKGGGNNVPERYGSDLWVADGYAYTGTWGNRSQPGDALEVWQLGPFGAPVLRDSVITNLIGTVSDVQVSPNGKLLLASSERGPNAGIQFYRLDLPGQPRFMSQVLVSTGIHTATFGTIGGRLYVFGARNPSGAALVIYDVTDMAR